MHILENRRFVKYFQYKIAYYQLKQDNKFISSLVIILGKCKSSFDKQQTLTEDKKKEKMR